jgi:hypothetical protein
MPSVKRLVDMLHSLASAMNELLLETHNVHLTQHRRNKNDETLVPVVDDFDSMEGGGGGTPVDKKDTMAADNRYAMDVRSEDPSSTTTTAQREPPLALQ